MTPSAKSILLIEDDAELTSLMSDYFTQHGFQIDGGYGEWFRHRLGHGIGLDVHEPPFLTSGDRSTLRAGMCFTVEPSIFIPGRFGARTEDVVVVGGDEGGRILTRYQRDLQVVA